MNFYPIKNVLKEKWYLILVFSVLYILLNGTLNGLKVTLPEIFSSFPLGFSLLFILFNFLIVPVLVSFTLILAYDKWRDLKLVSKRNGVLSIAGVFGALLGGACPGCFVGLFPAVVGLFGSAFTLSALPFYGLEIQFLSSIVLGVSIHYLTRPTVCLLKNHKVV